MDEPTTLDNNNNNNDSDSDSDNTMTVSNTPPTNYHDGGSADHDGDDGDGYCHDGDGYCHDANTGNSRSRKQHHNLVRLCGTSSSPCGYCHGNRANHPERPSSKSYGLLVQHLLPSTYESLLCRGWRRSGLHVYQPDNEHSCCPALTIRLPVQRFVPTKSQRRVWKRMDKVLGRNKPATTTPAASTATASTTIDTSTATSNNTNTTKHHPPRGVPAVVATTISQWTLEAIASILSPSASVSLPKQVAYKATNRRHVFVTTICAAMAGPSGGTIQAGALANAAVALLRPKDSRFQFHVHAPSGQILVTVPMHMDMDMEAEGEDHAGHGVISMETDPKDVICDWLQAKRTNRRDAPTPTPIPTPPYELQVTTMLATESALFPDVHRLYMDYQHAVHNDAHPLHSPLEVLQIDEHDDEDWGEASTEFIHQARTMLQQLQYPSDRLAWVTTMYSGFYRFLVESPLITTDPNLGTYHQHYRVDGVLVAVGVVDLLPAGVSSVYAFYEPNFAHSIVALGKLMILKEIEYTKALNKPYYYLGYYIESCTKMRYKAEYHPSELLCPTHFRWVDAKVGQSKLMADAPHHCCTLYTGPVDDTPVDHVDRILAHIPLSVGAPSHVTLQMLHTNGQDVVRPHLEEFLDHVGPEIAKECIVKLV